MRQLVALSLMQQQSASDRLRGVSWAYQVEPSDTGGAERAGDGGES